jgi:hypothetical protein
MIYDYSIGKMILQGGTFDGSDGNRQTWKLEYGDPLRLRWRFVSDMRKSDADLLDTDGGAWIDNVEIDNGSTVFTEDFETGVADPLYWSFPEYEGVLDAWHMVHDPDPLYEGDEGSGGVYDCRMDSSVVFRARPEGGYPPGTTWQNGWFYSLMTPAVPILDDGCAVQYDMFSCADITCDYSNTRVRFYDGTRGTWCPWIDPNGCVLEGNCQYWQTDMTEDLTDLYGAGQDSLQFAWDFMDLGRPGEFCYGRHAHSDLQIDNVSIGFFDDGATRFATRPIDLLHDTFETGLCGYNSFFNPYNGDTVDYYTGGPPPPRGKQFNVDVIDRDGITSVQLLGSINEGGSWITKAMALDTVYDPVNPDWGGTYFGTLCPADFSLSEWDKGTDIWYCVRVTDVLAQVEYFPTTADPAHPDHTGLADDYLDYSILSHYPPGYTDPTILLVNATAYDAYDSDPCTGSGAVRTVLADLYGLILEEAGYTYDRFDILGSGSSNRIEPWGDYFGQYDAVVWLTDMGYYEYGEKPNMCPMSSSIQNWFDLYVYQMEGRAIVIGDRIAYSMAAYADGGQECDSMGGSFLSGCLGTDYAYEMGPPLETPYIECIPEDTIDVMGNPVPVNLDTLTIYRGCPGFRELSWITMYPGSHPRFSAQPLLSVANPAVPDARMAIYTQSALDGEGQCTFFNFDLASTGYCGEANSKAGNMPLDQNDGRVKLIQFVLEDLYGLEPSTSGVNHVPGLPEPPDIKWALHQNSPNPFGAGTEIRYGVARQEMVRIKIYSPTGRLVSTLVNKVQEAGEYSAVWNGNNSAGKPVADGIYFYKMEAERFKATRKMLLLR